MLDALKRGRIINKRKKAWHFADREGQFTFVLQEVLKAHVCDLCNLYENQIFTCVGTWNRLTSIGMLQCQPTEKVEALYFYRNLKILNKPKLMGT